MTRMGLAAFRMAGAAFLALSAAGAEARAQAMTDAQALDTVKAAERAVDENRLAEAERLARSVSASASSDVTIRTRRRAFGALAEAHAREPGCAAVLPPLREAAAAQGAGEPEWDMLLTQIVECGDYPSAAVVLATLIERFPQSAATLRADTVARLAPYVRSAAHLSFLVNGDWSDESAPDLSAIRLYLLRVLLAEGHPDQAVEAARAMVANARADLGSAVVLLVDKTFDQIVRADPDTFNFDSMSAKQLANAFADVAAAPQRLDRINSLSEALYLRERVDEAGAIIDNALARVGEQRDGAAFVDLEESLNWTHDLRSRILWAQGRYDDANAALAEGSQAEENGRANVSQTLNFAGRLVHTRRPAAALAILNNFDINRASPYGRMVVRALRVCALSQLPDQEAMRRALADVVAHAEDSLRQLKQAAFCADDLDLAASAVIRQLDHPGDRRDAVLALQTFAGEGKATGLEAQLLARSDVQAAMARATHRRSFPILRPW